MFSLLALRQRMRVGALAKKAPSERRGRTWFCKVLAELGVEWTANPLVRESQRKEGAHSQKEKARLEDRRTGGSSALELLLPYSRLFMGAQRELKTLAEVMDGMASGRHAATFDVVAQRFRAIETSSTEEGGWVWARHLEVLPSQ